MAFVFLLNVVSGCLKKILCVIASLERSSRRGNPVENRRFSTNAAGVVTACLD